MRPHLDVLPPGLTGWVKFHHSIPFSNGEFKLSWVYNGVDSISITIDDSPNVIPDTTIFSYITAHLGDCGCN